MNESYCLRRKDLIEMQVEMCRTLGDAANRAPDAERWAQEFSGKLVRLVYHAHSALRLNQSPLEVTGECGAG